MPDAIIAGAVRTPVGKRKGALAGVHPVDLSALVLNALAERVGLDPALVDDVMWGCVSQIGEQSWNVGRNAVLAAGWPESVPGTTVDRQCGSSQQAVHQAAAAVISGQADVVVAGGVESMTRVPMGSTFANGPGEPFGPAMVARYPGVAFNQGHGAEAIAQRWKLSRTRLDEFSLESHAKAAAASDGGDFAAEIVPVKTDDGTVVDVDEGIRRGGTVESMAALKTPFAENGVITAGNASQISDGAAALLITSTAKAAELGLTPLARIHSATVVGDDPVVMLTGPIPATAKVLAKAGLTISDIGAFEVNEAFASVPLAWLAETGADPTRLNPRGGAIAIGHPLGGSGARIMTTLIHYMRDRRISYGLQTMCEGGGMANATVLEVL
jgi:acetyl-CoA acyltransferase